MHKYGVKSYKDTSWGKIRGKSVVSGLQTYEKRRQLSLGKTFSRE